MPKLFSGTRRDAPSLSLPGSAHARFAERFDSQKLVSDRTLSPDCFDYGTHDDHAMLKLTAPRFLFVRFSIRRRALPIELYTRLYGDLRSRDLLRHRLRGEFLL